MPNRNLLSSIWAMRELTKLTTDFWIFERNMPWVDMKKWKNHKKKRKKQIEPPHSMRIIFSPFAAFSSCRLLFCETIQVTPIWTRNHDPSTSTKQIALHSNAEKVSFL